MKSYKTSQLKIFNNNGKEYIYVYYKENNVALRINTRYEYVKNKMTTDNLYNSKMKNHEKINTEIREIQYAVDTYINLIGGHKPINQKECMEYVKEHKYDAIKAPASKAIILTSLSDYYEKFLDSKKSLPFLKPISLKNYVSFKNFLKEQTDENLEELFHKFEKHAEKRRDVLWNQHYDGETSLYNPLFSAMKKLGKKSKKKRYNMFTTAMYYWKGYQIESYCGQGSFHNLSKT